MCFELQLRFLGIVIVIIIYLFLVYFGKNISHGFPEKARKASDWNEPNLTPSSLVARHIKELYLGHVAFVEGVGFT